MNYLAHLYFVIQPHLICLKKHFQQQIQADGLSQLELWRKELERDFTDFMDQ